MRKPKRLIPPSPPAAAPILVWDGEAALTIESVTVWRPVIRDTGRGGHVTVEMAISLPRVRFLEMPDDPTPAAAFPDVADARADQAGEPLALAA